MTTSNSSLTTAKISLAQWSFSKSLFAGKMTNLDFPVRAKKEFNIDTVEYVNLFFKDKAEDTGYLKQILSRCRDNGVKNHLIMCDDEGFLADPDPKVREEAIENHYKWIDAAAYLGCSTVRVNTYGDASPEDIAKYASESLIALGEFAEDLDINIVVENHGGCTSDGEWLASLMKQTNRGNVGLLPDFGNFCLKREGTDPRHGKCLEWYDRYKGVAEMMPYVKTGVSAKTQDFDEQGNCIETDYQKMLQIVNGTGFSGYYGIEYGGSAASEEDGIKNTKRLIEQFFSNK